jgi:hypothetical protein
MWLNHAVVPHDSEAHSYAVAMLFKLVVFPVPWLPHYQRVAIPRFGINDRLGEALYAGDGVSHRPEDRGDRLLALLSVHSIRIRQPLITGPEAVQTAECTGNADRAARVSVCVSLIGCIKTVPADICADAERATAHGDKRSLATTRAASSHVAVVRICCPAKDVVVCLTPLRTMLTLAGRPIENEITIRVCGTLVRTKGTAPSS